MKNRVVAGIAAGTLAVGVLAGAAGAVLVNAGSAHTDAPHALMHGGYGANRIGMMGSDAGYGMMGGSWDSNGMLDRMRDHMGIDGSSGQ